MRVLGAIWVMGGLGGLCAAAPPPPAHAQPPKRAKHERLARVEQHAKARTPAKPDEPAKLARSAKPGEPAKLARSAKPGEPAKLVGSAKPGEPAKLVGSAKHDEPAKLAGSAKHDEPAKLVEAARAEKARTEKARDPEPAKLAVARPEAGKPRPEPLGRCTAALTARKVAWKPASRPGIAHGVEITGRLGGVRVSSPNEPLVIDCSLAVSLDEAGRSLRSLGVDAATFSSAYSRRLVRGTNRPSKHSYGLAIDVQAFGGPELGTLWVERDYEQGLGDYADCVGRPLTQAGATLKQLQCQLARSGLFHLVLTPDFDDAHHDHFHLEVRPWAERATVRVPSPAIY